MSLILGVDPGFASFGFALVRTDGATFTPVKMSVIRTKKASKKQNVYASEDNLNRARDITEELLKLLHSEFGEVQAVCAETMSFPRSSSVAAKMAMAWGVLAALTAQYNLPVVQVSPQGLKKAVCADASASKDEVKTALERLFGKELLASLVTDIPAGEHEHPYDALGAVVACRDSELIRLLRKQVG